MHGGSLSKKKVNLEKCEGRNRKSHALVIAGHHLDPAVLQMDVKFDFSFYIPRVSDTCKKKSGSGKCYGWQKKGLSVAIYFMAYS